MFKESVKSFPKAQLVFNLSHNYASHQLQIQKCLVKGILREFNVYANAFVKITLPCADDNIVYVSMQDAVPHSSVRTR